MENVLDLKIAVGVILYNPDSNRLLQCLNSISKQVESIYIFDNSTIPLEISLPIQVIYLTENVNKGIAYALNKIMTQAMLDGYKWVLTMDQDLILPEGMIADFKNYVTNSELGIICPQVIDKRRAYMKLNLNDTVTEYLDMCITSASCTSVAAWNSIGGFDEWLFIDLVDNDFCKRLRVSGYKILQVKKWVLDQEFGKIIPKPEKKQKFWIRLSVLLHNQNFAKFSYKKYVDKFRVYYTCRNIIYLNKKYKNYGGIGYRENYNCKTFAGFLICFVLPSILRATKKGELVKAVIKGFQDGRSKKVEPWVSVKHTGSNYHE